MEESNFENQKYEIVALEKNSTIKSQNQAKYIECFDCGNLFLNEKLKEIFEQEISGCLYGMINNIDEKLIGYYSISTSYIIDNPFFKYREEYYGDQGFFVGRPTLNLQYFAIDKEFQGQCIDEDKTFKFSRVIIENCVKQLKRMSKLVKLKDVTVYSTVQALGLYYDLGFTFLDKVDNDNYCDHIKVGGNFKLKPRELSEYNRICCGHKSDSGCFPMIGNVDSLGFICED